MTRLPGLIKGTPQAKEILAKLGHMQLHPIWKLLGDPIDVKPQT